MVSAFKSEWSLQQAGVAFICKWMSIGNMGLNETPEYTAAGCTYRLAKYFFQENNKLCFIYLKKQQKKDNQN